MALALNDYSNLLAQLRHERSLDGAVESVGTLVHRIVDDSGLDGEVILSPDAGRTAWHVEVGAASRAIATMDVLAEANNDVLLDRIDQVEAKANREWRRVTRENGPTSVRPWIGLVILDGPQPTPVRDQVTDLVRGRTLDAAILDVAGSADLGVDSFAASLLGRLVIVRTVVAALE